MGICIYHVLWSLTDSCRAVDPSSTDEVLTTLRGHAAGLDTAF